MLIDEHFVSNIVCSMSTYSCNRMYGCVNYVFTAGYSRQYTVSIAVPGSILDNAQSAELRTYLVGQVSHSQSVTSS